MVSFSSGHIDRLCDTEGVMQYKEKGYQVVCVGAGLMFKKFFDEPEGKSIAAIVDGVADNSPDKVGKNVEIGENSFRVDLPKSFASDEKKILWFITTKYFDELLIQLSSLLKNDDRCVLLVDITYSVARKNLTKRNAELIIHNDGVRKIPKVIHYCWFGKNKIPDEYQKWMSSWKTYCPDYEIMEWNDNNYDVNAIPYIAQAYEAKKYAFVSDYARLDVIYKYGGVYLDTDVELLKNLDPLLCQNGFLCFESDNFVATGLGFGAVKGQPVIKAFMDDYQENQFSLENMETCPVKQTRILEKMGLKRNGEFQQIDGINVYPQPLLNPMVSYRTKEILSLSNSYAIHHYAGSWL